MANQIRYQVGFDVQQNNLNQLKASLQDLQKMKISDIMKINETDAASATSALNKIKDEAGKVEDALKQAFNTKLNTVNIETFNQSLKQSGTSIEQVYQAFRAAGSTGEAAFRSLSSSVLSTNIQLKETHNILDKMATTLANTVKWNAASAAVNGMTRSVEQAWGYVKSLDTSLNNIRIVTGKSAEEMGNFAAQANNAAKELGRTTTDYTNASLIFAQQGLNDKEIAERAAITLKTANVTGQSTDAVSEQLTAVWNGYKVNADEAELYIDRLAAVAATTASDLEELSTGMSKVASAAAAMGVGEDQLAAQLSTIISVTRQAPESVGTALRTIYARISDIKAGIDEDGVTLGNYSGKMAELGINVLDMNGNLRDMGEVMEEIGGKWGDLTREQQVYLAQTMAGQRQYNNLLALFDNFEQYNKALATAQNAAGTLQEQQDIHMESTAAHLEVLRASVEDIYDSLADTDSINGLIDGLSTAATFTANLVDGLGGGGAVLKALGSIGVTVFSEQIAKGLNTTITNLEIGKENARQFSEALQTVREWRGIEGLDKTSDQLLANREQLLELARLMTPEQFAGMQTLLNDITTLGNEIQEIQSKLDPLENTLKDFTDTSLMDVLGNEKEIDNIISKIDDPIDSLEKLQQKVKDTKEAFRDSFGEASALLGKSGVNTFDEVFDEAQIKITSFLDTLHDLKGTDAFKGLSDEAKAELDKIDTEWDELLSKLNTMTPEESSQAFKAFFDRLSQVATTSSDEIQRKYEELLGVLNDPTIVTSLEQKQQQLNKMVNDFVTGQERMQRAAKIENYAKMAGGIAQVGSAIQQVQNLGSIWKNEDLTTSQKLLQTITNLAISLPMLATGFTKATTALGLMKTMTTAEAVAAGISTSAQAAHAVSIGLVESASGAAAIKVQLLNTTLMINPFVAVAAGVIALVTALGAMAKATEEARQAAIKLDQANIEAENKKQEEVESTRNLLSALDDLNKQYEDGEITRSDLKSTIQDLIDQYGLEGDAADRLASSYGNLAEYIKKAREEAALEGKASAERELAAAEDEIQQTAKGKGGKVSSGVYSLSFEPGLSLRDEPKIIQDIMRKAGFSDSYTPTGESTGILTSILGKDYTTDDLVSLYDTVQGIVDEIQNLDTETLSLSDRNQSEYYSNMVKWLDSMSDAVERYRNAQEDLKKYSAEVTAITAENTGTVDFSNVQNANQYLEQRLALIQEIQAMLDKNGDTTSDAAAMADTYLRDNFKSLYTQYSEAADYIEQIREKFGETNTNIEQMISDMDADHLGMLMDLDQSTIKDWDTLADIIQRISGIDLSNTAASIALDPESAQAAAADQYNIYQSLEDQVRGGKSISKKEMESLDPEIQKLFSMMANGTFKMTGDAEEFYNKVNSFKLDGFFDTIDAINRELEKNQALQDKNFNYKDLDQSANTTKFVRGEGQVDTIDYDLVNDQLDYLQTVTDTNSELGTQIKLWAYLAKQTELEKGHVNAIAEAVANAGDQTANLTERQKELNEMADEVAHQLHDAMFPTDSDVDTEVLETLSETIQDIADESDELADSLTEDSRAAEDVAESILRFDNAIEDVVKNYENWMDVLNNGSIQEQAEIIDDLQDAYADLLDLDGSSLSNDFLTNAENLDLMKAAIDGDIDAYNELLEAAQRDIVAHLSLSEEDYNEFVAAINNIQTMMDEMNFQDIEVGASLDDANFIAGLENMINAANMTAQQATDYLASMGVDAEVIQQKSQGTETQTQTGWTSDLVPVTATGEVPIVSGIGFGTTVSSQPITFTTYSSEYTPTTETTTDTKENSAFSLKVTSAHKSSGGGFKFSQAKNGGGSAGNNRRSGGGGKGKGGGGKGGKGKTQEPDKSKKDFKKPMEDTRDIYHDINIELEQIDRRLDRVQKKQDRLYGKQLLDNLNKQSKILDQHKAKLEEKNELQKQDLKSQQETLKNLGVTFDKYGNISNYMDVLATKQEQINAKTQQYNSLIKAYNKATDKEIKKQIADEAEKLNKQIKKYEDEYKELEDKIKGYDDLREDMEDLVDQIEEETQKQIEINIQKFRMEVEIRLKLGEAERDWNKFRREVLEHTDIIKDTDFKEIFSDTAQELNDITSYFNVRGSKGSLQTLTEQLMDTRAEIEAINRTGGSAIYGDNKAQAMEDLQNDLKELMGQMEDIQDLIDNIDKAYLDTIDDVEEQFDKQIEGYEYVGDLIEHDIDLLTLLYGDRNYDAMDKYYSTLERNNLKQLDSLKKQRDFWKEQWDEAVARGDTQAAKQFEENYKETIKNLNEVVEDAAKNIQNKYINAIDKIFDELDKKISNGRGTDYLSTQWELMNKNADEYLDTINTAFAIQETERKYQKALDETKSIKNQQALKKLMDEQLSILKNKEKVTQYDVDRAEKLLQVEQARIALQDAQSAKTSMRLKRDSQGNYSYEYVADNGAVDDAQANLAQAQNDLYNFDKERYQSNLDDMLSAWRDFQSDYKDIVLDTSLTEQERIERLSLLREQYGEYINDKTAENLVVRNNLMESAFTDLAALYNTDVENYNQMSVDEKEILMGDLVPAWESGIQQMSDKVAGEGGFIPACEEAFESITEKTKDYEEQLDNMANAAGVSLDYVTQGVDLLSDTFENLIKNNDELIDRMYTEVDSIQTLRDAASELVSEYRNVYNEAKGAVSEIHNFIQEEQKRAAAYVSTANVAVESYNRTAKAYADAYDQMASSFENYAERVRSAASGDSSGGGGGSGGSSGGSGDSGGGGSSSGTGSQSKTHVTTTWQNGQATQVNWQRDKRGNITRLASGGYTGDWHSSEGRIAVLHQKQLVLNESDTKNILDSVSILRSMSDSVMGVIRNRNSNLNLANQSYLSSDGGVEQNVHIEASFPNVDSKREIEEALNDLVNLAAQRVMRRN